MTGSFKLLLFLFPVLVTDDLSALEQASNSFKTFIRHSIDKENPYVGEQVTLTFEYINSHSKISNPTYIPPSFTGFWTVDLPRPAPSTKVTNGVSYVYSSIKTALFPVTPGTYVIEPASLRFSYGGIFRKSEDQVLYTESVLVNVKPLPEKGKPDNFDGVVGNFRISVSKDKNRARTGELISVSVTVSGTGNLDMISSLTTPDLIFFKTFDPRIIEQRKYDGHVAGGSKTFEYIFIPIKPGEFTVGEFKLSYFDPSESKYSTLSTTPFKLYITPGVYMPESTHSNFLQRPFTSNDIKPIKPDKTDFSTPGQNIPKGAVLLFLYMIPSIFMLITIFHKNKFMISGIYPLKKHDPYRNARGLLKTAKKELRRGNSSGCCAALESATIQYLSLKLGFDKTSDISQIQNQLSGSHIPNELTSRVINNLKFLEFVRFSSSGQSRGIEDNLIRQTAEIISDFRKLGL